MLHERCSSTSKIPLDRIHRDHRCRLLLRIVHYFYVGLLLHLPAGTLSGSTHSPPDLVPQLLLKISLSRQRSSDDRFRRRR